MRPHLQGGDFAERIGDFVVHPVGEPGGVVGVLAEVREREDGEESLISLRLAGRIPTMASFRRIFNYVGAFPLLDGSKDAAEVVRLSPGAYTVVANPPAGDRGGEVLIEVYFLP